MKDVRFIFGIMGFGALQEPFVKNGNYNNKWGNCKERCKLTPKWLNRFAGCVSSHFPPHKYYKSNIKIFGFQLLNKSNRALDFFQTLSNTFFTLLYWIFPNSIVWPKNAQRNWIFCFKPKLEVQRILCLSWQRHARLPTWPCIIKIIFQMAAKLSI